ncbi:MAG: DUF2735 domain-containing protein [Hyphomicrobium sp.]|jgi:hypothetical protein
MKMSSHRETAKIYQFPVGGRAGLAVRRELAKTIVEEKHVAPLAIASGCGWYHEQALLDVEPARKR